VSGEVRTRWWQALLLVVVSTTVTLVAAELALRFGYWRKGIGRGDVRELLLRSQSAELEEIRGGGGLYGLLLPSAIPEAVYEIKPHLKGRFLGQSLATNRWGFRGPDVEQRQPPGVVRVLGIGDSHMFGWGMPQEACYMALLEHELNERAVEGVRFEVLNFGTPGYNTVMEAALFEHKALAFEPDFVIVHFVGNDFNAPHFLAPPRSFRPSRWFLVETAKGLFSEVEDEFDASALGEEERQELRRSAVDPYRELGGVRSFRAAVTRVRELAERRGIPALFLMLGEGSSVRRQARDIALEAGYHLLNPAEYFKRMLVEAGREATPVEFRRFFSRGDKHPTRAGHAAYAEALRCELAHLGLQGLQAEATTGCLPLQDLPQPQPPEAV
jgi:hypothetical protein